MANVAAQLAAVLLAFGGAAALLVFGSHSTAVVAAAVVALVLGAAGFIWAAFLTRKHEDDEAAIKIGKLGKGMIERNITTAAKLYDGQEADELTIRDNTVGTPGREDNHR